MHLAGSLPRHHSRSTPTTQLHKHATTPFQRASTSSRPAFSQSRTMATNGGGGWLETLLKYQGNNGNPEYESTDSDNEYSPVAPKSKKLRDYAEIAYLTGRHKGISRHFPKAMGIDDFLYRMEIALFGYGFDGDNSIAMVNLCRDEITVTLKEKIDQVFGCCFNTNGLGGVLTCGVTGVSAGLSHAPISQGSGKERYIFFSFPHISIDARGEIGTISRPGRPGASCACGALNKALIEIKRDGVTSNCKIPGVHEPLDPEFTILKQRLARRMRYEGIDDDDVLKDMNLVELTALAERTITDDLEYLISKTVDPKKADYAVVTGVQIHNWGTRFDDDSPNLEFIAPENFYVVVNGEKTYMDLNAMPSFTPRQVRLLSDKNAAGGPSRASAEMVCNNGGSSTLREIDPPYLYNSREIRRRKRDRAQSYLSLIEEEGLEPETTCSWPSWQTQVRVSDAGHVESGNSAIHFEYNMDGVDNMSAEERSQLQSKYDAALPPVNGKSKDEKIANA